MRRLLFLLALLAACQSRGQLVLGLATDLSAKGQLDEVHLTVTRRGETTPVVSRQWLLSGVPARDYRLPGSFNLYANDGQEPTFDVMIEGFLDHMSKVKRPAALGILKGSDRFVRLTLVAQCEETGCPGSLACVEGQCVAVGIDARRLPKYAGSMVTTTQCSSATTFIDTSTKAAMPLVGSCEDDEVCSEGTCLLAKPPGADPVPFTGTAAEVFGLGVPGEFASVGALDAGRFFATATQLGDGRVLVLGGLSTFAADGSGTPVGGAVIYDASYAAFRRIVDPPATLAGHTATLLADGTVLFVGSASGAPVAFTFDPATESFTMRAAPQAARQFHTATLLGSGQVLLVGGLAGTTIQPSAERWDPATQTFTTIAAGPVAARYFHAATTLANGDVLVTGGLVTVAGGAQPTASAERYVAASDSFTEEPSMNRPRAMHTATLLSDGSVLAVGGFPELPGAAHDDAELLLGSAPRELDTRPPFPAGLQQAIPLGGDRILFVGGATTLDPDPSALPTGGAYLWQGGEFVALPSPKTARVAGFAATIPETLRADAAPDVLVGGGVQTNAATDGGLSDLGPGDMAMLCDPVHSTGCPDDTTQKCTVAGASTFGPGLFTDGPRCVVAPTSPAKLGDPCSAADADVGADDGCIGGTVCMTDTSDGLGHCQKLCATDADCPDLVRDRCALVVATSQDTTAYGVCQIGCTYPDEQEVCFQNQADMGAPTLSCHWVPNIDKPGDPFEAQGACRFDGYLTYAAMQAGQSSCTQADEADACAADYQCVGGQCLSMCLTNNSDFSMFCQSPCAPVVSGDTASGSGVCVPMID